MTPGAAQRPGRLRSRATSRSPSTGSSATSTRRRWWAPTARSTGTAARTSTRRASSARSSTAAGAATTGSRRPTEGWTPKQLYFPDTNVLITRFLTHGGVGEVQDFMPVHDAPGSVFRHRLIRRVLGVRGELTFRIEVEPRFNYGRDPHSIVFHENGVVFRSEGMSLALETSAPLTLRRDGRDLRGHAGRRREPDLRARAGARGLRAAPLLRGRDRRGLRPHDRVLAQLALQVAVPGALARDGAPLRPDAQAAHLPAHRRDRGGSHHEPARSSSAAGATGTTATPGSATPPSRSTPCCGSASPRRPRRSWSGCASASARTAGRARAAPDHVRDRRPLGARGGGARPPRGLPRIRARPDRKRRSGAAAARHLRRADRLGLLLQPPRLADRPRRVGRPDPRDRVDLRELGPGGRGHLGGARRAQALHLLAADVLGRASSGR